MVVCPRPRTGPALAAVLLAFVLALALAPRADAAHGGASVVSYCNSGVKAAFPVGWCGFFARHSWNANIIQYSGPIETTFPICAALHNGYPVASTNVVHNSCTFRGTAVFVGNNAEQFYYLGGFNGDTSRHTFYTYGVN